MVVDVVEDRHRQYVNAVDLVIVRQSPGSFHHQIT